VDIAPQRGDRKTASTTVTQALEMAIDYFFSLQSEDGHWAGDYGGPFFLLPGFVIMAHAIGYDLGTPTRSAMLTYLRNHQQRDGSWGLHLEGPGTMLGTTLNYVSARLLGMKCDEPAARRSQQWVKEHGGAVSVPAWGKVWLSVLGTYDWEGVNPTPPEIWLLPDFLPFHPWRFWCHTRMVTLPMTLLYGMRFVGPHSSIIDELREELYPIEAYSSIDWPSHRLDVCELDLYSPPTPIWRAVSWCLALYERFHVGVLRKHGMEFAKRYLDAEDSQTNYVCIGPVNKAFNMLCAAIVHGKSSPQFEQHAARLRDYLYVAEDGMRVQGYGGSQLWDTAFTVQALAEGGMCHRVADQLRHVHEFVDHAQLVEEVPLKKEFYRDTCRGGWTFSTADNYWPVADCTAEGMRASLILEDAGLTSKGGPLEPHRYFAAVNLILEYQNDDGGWPTYEKARSGAWLEWLNPAEIFGDIMIDYSYIELSSACIQGLVHFQSRFPDHRTDLISKAIARGMTFLRKQQRPDGSWYGSWGVCFTYAAWFAVEALHTAGGGPEDDELMRRTCEFLLSKQHPDGGWGETYMSCVRKEYVDGPSSVVHTAWALLALIGAQCPNKEAIDRAVRFLISRQRVDGDFPQEQTVGIFNRSCGISYSNYRNIFPIWALGAYSRKYEYKDPKLVGVPSIE
jgi:squalene/oxidosqualene cyclase-like protein